VIKDFFRLFCRFLVLGVSLESKLVMKFFYKLMMRTLLSLESVGVFIVLDF